MPPIPTPNLKLDEGGRYDASPPTETNRDLNDGRYRPEAPSLDRRKRHNWESASVPTFSRPRDVELSATGAGSEGLDFLIDVRDDCDRAQTVNTAELAGLNFDTARSSCLHPRTVSSTAYCAFCGEFLELGSISNDLEVSRNVGTSPKIPHSLPGDGRSNDVPTATSSVVGLPSEENVTALLGDLSKTRMRMCGN